MNRPELTYQFYTQYGGSLEEAEFNKLLTKATSVVDYLTAQNAVVESNEQAYLRGICAAVDSIYEHGDEPALQSVRVGSFSATEKGPSSGRSLAYTAARSELALAVPSLLYGGVA